MEKVESPEVVSEVAVSASPTIETTTAPEVEEEPMESPEEAVAEARVAEEVDALIELLPDWMLKSGDIRSERVQVADFWVERARGRYAWEDGSQVEVEVSDLGTEATQDQFKSLGFDFAQEAEETEGGGA